MYLPPWIAAQDFLLRYTVSSSHHRAAAQATTDAAALQFSLFAPFPSQAFLISHLIFFLFYLILPDRRKTFKPIWGALWLCGHSLDGGEHSKAVGSFFFFFFGRCNVKLPHDTHWCPAVGWFYSRIRRIQDLSGSTHGKPRNCWLIQ